MDNPAAQDILGQIRVYEQKIALLTTEIQKLNDQRERVFKAREQIRLKEADFDNVIMIERSRSDNTRYASNVRFASSYADRMDELLLGNRYLNASSSFGYMRDILTTKATRLREDIEEREAIIRSCRTQITYLRSRLTMF